MWDYASAAGRMDAHPACAGRHAGGNGLSAVVLLCQASRTNCSCQHYLEFTCYQGQASCWGEKMPAAVG